MSTHHGQCLPRSCLHMAADLAVAVIYSPLVFQVIAELDKAGQCKVSPAHRDALATGEPSPALCDSVPVLQHCLFPALEHRDGRVGWGKWDPNKHCTWSTGCQLHMSWSQELFGSEAAAAFACVSSVWEGWGTWGTCRQQHVHLWAGPAVQCTHI